MAKEEKVSISFILNGQKTEAEVTAALTVLEMLRRDFSLTAVKEGCGKGECGACTIILNGQPVTSCLKLAAQLKPTDEITTLEGLEKDPLLKNLQKAYVEEGAVQCGFCIPGMIVSSYVLLKKNHHPTEQDIKEALAGNICRCTGYSKILTAVKRALPEGK